MTRRRRRQLNAIIEEARLWSFALLLPPTVFANDEAVHELDTTLQTIIAKLQGKHVSKDKIDGVIGKIARNILVPGLTNVDAEYEYYPASLLDKHMLNDTLVPTHVLDQLYQGCPEFRRKYPAARTWREIMAHADAYTMRDEPLQNVLEELQFENTCYAFGLPYMFNWSSRAQRKIVALLQSSDPSKLSSELRQTRLYCDPGRRQRQPRGMVRLNRQMESYDPLPEVLRLDRPGWARLDTRSLHHTR